MGFDIVDVFQAGGMQLVLVSAFILFQIWMIRYFIKQIEEGREERRGALAKFDIMLNEHCKSVSDALNKQEQIFQLLVTKINGER